MRLVERSPEAIELTLGLAQVKKLYVALFRQLHAGGPNAIDEFDEDDMLLTLQSYLQRRAREAGVDSTIHSDWERFLGIMDGPSCEQRLARRNHPPV